MFYLTATFWLLSISSLLILLTKKKFECVIPFAYIFGVFILYIFAYFNQLRLGYYVSLLIGLVSVVCVIYKSVKDIEFKENFLSRFLTMGLFAYLILLVYAFALYHNKGFEACDEFMHWGTMVRETFRLNGFYSLPESILRTHKDYPPFFCLLETLWCLFAKSYKEPYLYMGLVTFWWSLFTPLFSKYNVKEKKDCVKSLLLLIAIVLFGLINSRTTTASDWAFMYNTIYVDWTLCIFLAFSLFLVYREQEYDTVFYILLGACLTTLLMMKQMGLPFYMLVLLFTVIKIFIYDRRKEYIKSFVLLIVIPFFIYLTWKMVIKKYGIVGQFNVSTVIKEILALIKGASLSEEAVYRPVVFKYFIHELFTRSLFLHPIKMPFFVVVIIQTLIVCLLKNKNSYTIAGVYLFGSLAYSFTMLMLYMFSFSYEEALELASFDRYMNSYLIAGFALCLMLAASRTIKIRDNVLIIAVVLLFVEFANFYQIIPTITPQQTLFTNVLVVDEEEKGKMPIERSDLSGVKIDITNADYLDFSKMSVEELKQELSKYGAVYIISTNKSFLKVWNEAELNTDICDGALYDVSINDDGVVLNRNYMYLNQVVYYYYQ